MRLRSKLCAAALTATLLMPVLAFAQSAQVGADKRLRPNEKVVVRHLHYRPARWEEEHVKEYENLPRNEGGLLYLYLQNVSDEAVDLKFWRANGEDESYWRLNHLTAWDRLYDRHLQPGQSTVLEINALTKDFAPGGDFKFAYVGDGWSPVCVYKGTLEAAPARISYVRVHDDMKTLTVHLRDTSGVPADAVALAVAGKTIAETTWQGADLATGAAIATVVLEQPLQASELLMLQATITRGSETTEAWAHRRAYPDYFPIGVWSNGPDTWDTLYRMHIDTMVAGGSPDDRFYTEAVPKYGFRNMVHTGVPTEVDRVRAVADRPEIACWMIQDEPDWSIASNIMLHTDNELRKYDRSKPSFITLCRNVKFMEYAPIADIPCQDHYSVTAPSSSQWPKPYGTRLEETAYYTRDLKYASEPKPIWIWTQGIANWGERPKRPVPTPNELAAQLLLNIGRGAKGIIWFNYAEDVAKEWPDAVEAMRDWGRVMRMLRDDLLDGDIADVPVEMAADLKLDVATVLSGDALSLLITNTDYEIDPEAYPFKTKENASLTVHRVPAWLKGQPVWRVSPEGVAPLERTWSTDSGDDAVAIQAGTIEASAVVVIASEARAEQYRSEYAAALAQETAAAEEVK
ncbi:MAG: hypothetical protein GC168_16635 [Candidatus Hydrogenedens sp.]|nr:hypothetical protein [Candidatus Hydrogenedens sp.]